MNPEQTQPESPKPGFRPPDFLLPKADGPTRRRLGEPDIYLSWSGQVYGPAAVDDVITGIRTSWFEDDALFWFEGQTSWRPVAEFPDLATVITQKRNSLSAVPPGAGAAKSDAPRRPLMPRPPKPQRDYRGLGIVIMFVLLAIGLTVGILLLLHTFVRG